MDASWDDLRCFLAAADQASLTAGARVLGLGQATMSRRVAALEQALGKALFRRGRRGLELTAAGERLRPWARSMETSLRSGAAELSGLEERPEGLVRLATSPDLAVDLVVPLLPGLRRRYPALRVELLADTRLRDVGGHEVDLALRLVKPARGPLVARKLTEVRLGVYGSRDYAASLPRGARLDDVEFIGLSPGVVVGIEVVRSRREPFLVTNDFVALARAAQAGLGAVVTSSWHASRLGLVRLDVPQPSLPPVPLYLVVHEALREVPRVAVVAEALVAATRSWQRELGAG